MTTNCIQKPAASYLPNIFTTGLVGWPGAVHVHVDGALMHVDGGHVGPRHHDEVALEHAAFRDILGGQKAGGLVALYAPLDHDGGTGRLALHKDHGQRVLGALEKHEAGAGGGPRRGSRQQQNDEANCPMRMFRQGSLLRWSF